MNCRSFQNRLYEYVEGSLSADAQSEADQHLAACSACRQAVRKEQQLAQAVANGLRSDAKTLTLRPEIRSRILAATEVISRPPVRESVAELWNRLFRFVAIPASLLLVAGFLLFGHFPGAETRKTAGRAEQNVPAAVSIQISYRVPTYKFRQEGGRVVDSLSDETVVATGTFQSGGQSPVLPNPERKTSL